MAWLGSWLLGVTAAAILCALADRLMPDGAVRQAGKVTLGLVMLLALIRPLFQLEVEPPGALWEGYRAQTAAQVQELEEERDGAMKVLIERELAAYIVDKAEQLGAACTAQVTCRAGENGVFLPERAEVQGCFTPEQQEALAQILEEELGISRDQQTIQTEEEST